MNNQKYKFDAGKPQYRLLPPHSLAEIVEVLTYGASKYKAHSWVNVSSDRYLDAAYRHLESRRMGIETDEESGRAHLAMVIVNLLFLLERDLSHDSRATGKKLRSFFEEISEENEALSKKDN